MAKQTADHAASMDAIYRVQRHFYDLTRRYYLFGRDRLIADLAVPDGGTVLEVGCGTARNLIHIARRYPSARLYGFDISAAMLATARRNVERAGLSSRITLAQGDASNFCAERLFGCASFDRVVASYTMSMIPPWRAAVGQALASVSPGGRLCIVDFGQQERLPRWFRDGLHRWLAHFSVTPRTELIDLCRAAAGAQATVDVTRLMRGYAWILSVTRSGSDRPEDSVRPATN